MTTSKLLDCINHAQHCQYRWSRYLLHPRDQLRVKDIETQTDALWHKRRLERAKTPTTLPEPQKQQGTGVSKQQRLSLDDARAIRAAHAASPGPATKAALAVEYGVAVPTIYKILNGKIWKEENHAS